MFAIVDLAYKGGGGPANDSKANHDSTTVQSGCFAYRDWRSRASRMFW